MIQAYQPRLALGRPPTARQADADRSNGMRKQVLAASERPYVLTIDDR
jgi:hypothetical protein